MNLVKKAMHAVQAALTPRDTIAQKLEALVAEQERAAAARAQAIEAAKLAEAEWEKPRLERMRLEQAHAAQSWPDAAARGKLEQQLRDAPPVEIRAFSRWCDRAHAVLGQRLPITEEVNAIMGTLTITNLSDHERRARALAALVGARVEIRDSMWRLRDQPLRARLAELRAAIENEIPDALLEQGELDVPRQRDAAQIERRYLARVDNPGVSGGGK